MAEQLISKTWHIPAMFGAVIPGALVYDKGMVSFITEDSVEFTEPLSSLSSVKWPFLRMGFGFDTVVNGKKYKFSFAKPNPSAPEINILAGDPLPRVIGAGQYFEDISSLLDIKTDKAVARQWKELLEQ